VSEILIIFVLHLLYFRTEACLIVDHVSLSQIHCQHNLFSLPPHNQTFNKNVLHILSFRHSYSPRWLFIVPSVGIPHHRLLSVFPPSFNFPFLFIARLLWNEREARERLIRYCDRLTGSGGGREPGPVERQVVLSATVAARSSTS